MGLSIYYWTGRNKSCIRSDFVGYRPSAFAATDRHHLLIRQHFGTRRVSALTTNFKAPTLIITQRQAGNTETMLAAATSFFARTNISQSYNIGQPSSSSRPTTPGISSTSSAATSASGLSSRSERLVPAASTPAFPVGLWKVQSAYHKVTNKRVSVWSFDKRSPEMERLGALAKERTLEVLKAEASTQYQTMKPNSNQIFFCHWTRNRPLPLAG